MERTIFRIIDANSNRAREAARLMEEYCRFTLNRSDLAARAKMLRHQICDTIGNLDANTLIASRDIHTDVGRGMKIEGQLTRSNLSDCFTAAAKRLTEALRVLAETTQTIEPTVAQVFEQLRFDAYSLEKDTIIQSNAAEKFASVRLYVLLTITDTHSDSQILRLAKDCAAGGADCIQIRAKGISDRRSFELAREVVKICKDKNVISIINDRIDVAVAVGADGVHLGWDDLPADQGRKMQLKPMIFGLTTHSIDQLKAAISQKVTYVGLGPAMASSTKPHLVPAGLGYIAEAIQLLEDSGVRHVAIGGITLDNIDEVLKAGARSVAVCSSVANESDPGAICSQLKNKIISWTK
ncbi:MAG: thiamine phosphate synthase [Planctomycetota bacterium]|jgi:thiamine-phosphate pyrophosphorylase